MRLGDKVWFRPNNYEVPARISDPVEAVVTRIWSPGCVNLIALIPVEMDGVNFLAPDFCNSVMLAEDGVEANYRFELME